MDDLSFIIPMKEVRKKVRKDWNGVDPRTKVKESSKVSKPKREKNNLRKQIEEALDEY